MHSSVNVCVRADLRDPLVRHLLQVVPEHAEWILGDLAWTVKGCDIGDLGQAPERRCQRATPIKQADLWSGGWPHELRELGRFDHAVSPPIASKRPQTTAARELRSARRSSGGRAAPASSAAPPAS